MSIEPVLLLLAPMSTREGVVGSTQHGDKDLGLTYLTGIGIDHRHRGATVVHKQLFTGSMRPPQAALLTRQPLQVTVTELGIAVTLAWMLFPVFLPQQLPGHPFTLELLVHLGKVQFNKATLTGNGLAGEQQTPQRTLIHIRR